MQAFLAISYISFALNYIIFQGKSLISCGFAGYSSAPKLAKEIQKKPLCCAVLPYVALNITMPASTDVGDVSCNVPTVQFVMSCYANGTPAHSWQMVSQGVTSLAHKGMLKAAEVLARTGIDLIQHPEAVKRAREEFEEVNASGYVCPIPDGVKPSPVK